MVLFRVREGSGWVVWFYGVTEVFGIFIVGRSNYNYLKIFKIGWFFFWFKMMKKFKDNYVFIMDS